MAYFNRIFSEAVREVKDQRSADNSKVRTAIKKDAKNYRLQPKSESNVDKVWEHDLFVEDRQGPRTKTEIKRNPRGHEPNSSRFFQPSVRQNAVSKQGRTRNMTEQPSTEQLVPNTQHIFRNDDQENRRKNQKLSTFYRAESLQAKVTGLQSVNQPKKALDDDDDNKITEHWTDWEPISKFINTELQSVNQPKEALDDGDDNKITEHWTDWEPISKFINTELKSVNQPKEALDDGDDNKITEHWTDWEPISKFINTGLQSANQPNKAIDDDDKITEHWTDWEPISNFIKTGK